MTEFVNVSTHPQSLVSGRVLAPGESAEVSDDPHDRALIADGALIERETSMDYASLHRDQLEGLAEAAGLDVKGTGKDGGIVVADLVRALTAHDKKESR
jgi:hypothetical protein